MAHFPHQGKIVSIDQLDYYTPNSRQVPELVGVGLFKDPCLMGVFLPPIFDTIVTSINMISSIETHMGDPWVLPNLSEIESYGDTMPLSPTELSYSSIQSESESTICFPQEDGLD